MNTASAIKTTAHDLNRFTEEQLPGKPVLLVRVSDAITVD